MTTIRELIALPGNSYSIWVRACNIVTVRVFAPHCIYALKNVQRPSLRIRALPCFYNFRVMNVGLNTATSRTMWLRPISGLKHTLPTLVSTLHMRTAISLGQCQPWTCDYTFTGKVPTSFSLPSFAI